ncbi:MAG: HlyD family efflux transporter periplasmic adaptor subunit [Prochlorococcus marinus CUG1434]|nr:HlyD family efflux transporter periplasmic adaptor subunit [Prochlorococcus marinus CUG1434]
MRHFITKFKNKIKNSFSKSSFDDFQKNSKKNIFKAKSILEKNLKQYGIDKYAYKAQQYFNKAQDKIERSFKNISFDESLLKQSSFWLKSVTWTLIGTSSFAVLWLSFAKTDEVVIALGKLEPKGDVKDIQIPIGGVIEEILVESGDNVDKNQVLVQLDKEASFEKYKSFQNALEEKELQLEKNNSILSLKRDQKKQELLLIQEKIRSTSEKKDMNLVLLNKLEQLYKDGGISKFKYLEYKINHDDIVSELSKLKIEKEISAGLINQDLKKLESEQAFIRAEIASLKSELIAAKVTLKYQSLKSPVSGIVFDLKPTTEGYVAQSSEPIMKIVPFDDLEADIEIPSNKIGFVKVGMPVEISIDSFPSTDFGVLMGSVKKIGSDALPPSQLEQRTEYKYPATIELEEQTFKIQDGSTLPLQVGMSLSANIKLRKVSYLQLLFSNFEKKTDALKRI